MARAAHLTRYASQDVTLLGDACRPGGVTLAFTERTGGVSKAPYTSLNLGADCGDNEADVRANRQLVLDALGAGELAGRLVNPLQVHGTTVLTVTSGAADDVARAQREAREGADAIVCTAADVPVLLCYADCVPVVLVAPGAFAVVHSGWRGAIARISAKALAVLCEVSGVTPAEVNAYVGPHIAGEDYEVSPELLARFVDEFGAGVALPGTRLDLGVAVRDTLLAAGIAPDAIAAVGVSTAQATDRFFSYRSTGGRCGRHGALAYLPATSSREV
jgi:YfiH family protein